MNPVTMDHLALLEIAVYLVRLDLPESPVMPVSPVTPAEMELMASPGPPEWMAATVQRERLVSPEMMDEREPPV